MIDYASPRRKRQGTSGKRSFLVLVFVFFLLWAVYGSINAIFFKKEATSEKSVGESSKNLSGNSLKGAVEASLVGEEGKYGIVIKNLKTNETYFFKEHQQFDSASLYKLWVMAAVFDQINQGKLQEDQKLKEEVSILNEKFHIASESAELTEGAVEFTVRDALEKMITISDNYAALLLTAKIRLSTVAAFLEEHGFKESKVSRDDQNPVTTASDIELFLEKLYRSELADPDTTEKMLALLRRQRLNEKLPKKLPKDVVIAHKTGELGTLSHDSGIVYGPKGDYIIVVLSDSKKRLETDARIATISRAVYDYFSK